jgi:hypothetical protein
MSVKVKTPLYQNYNMPNLCVSCGEPNSTTTFFKLVSLKQSSRMGKLTRTISVPFPLCPTCAEIEATNKPLITYLWVAAMLLSTGLCFIRFLDWLWRR